MEQWKAIPNTNGKIEVSTEGRVRSWLRGEANILKPQDTRKGYKRISYTFKRDKRHISVHRAVAQAFIPNPDNLPQVNHIDGDKSNNRVNNLEWVNNAENAHHAIVNGLWESVFEGAKKENERRMKPIVAYGQGEILCFKSISDAERHFNSRHITDVLKGKRSHVKGWTFAYREVMPNGDNITKAER